jgi:hypothetical protein
MKMAFLRMLVFLGDVIGELDFDRLEVGERIGDLSGCPIDRGSNEILG